MDSFDSKGNIKLYNDKILERQSRLSNSRNFIRDSVRSKRTEDSFISDLQNPSTVLTENLMQQDSLRFDFSKKPKVERDSKSPLQYKTIRSSKQHKEISQPKRTINSQLTINTFLPASQELNFSNRERNETPRFFQTNPFQNDFKKIESKSVERVPSFSQKQFGNIYENQKFDDPEKQKLQERIQYLEGQVEFWKKQKVKFFTKEKVIEKNYREVFQPSDSQVKKFEDQIKELEMKLAQKDSQILELQIANEHVKSNNYDNKDTSNNQQEKFLLEQRIQKLKNENEGLLSQISNMTNTTRNSHFVSTVKDTQNIDYYIEKTSNDQKIIEQLQQDKIDQQNEFWLEKLQIEKDLQKKFDEKTEKYLKQIEELKIQIKNKNLEEKTIEPQIPDQQIANLEKRIEEQQFLIEQLSQKESFQIINLKQQYQDMIDQNGEMLEQKDQLVEQANKQVERERKKTYNLQQKIQELIDELDNSEFQLEIQKKENEKLSDTLNEINSKQKFKKQVDLSSAQFNLVCQKINHNKRDVIFQLQNESDNLKSKIQNLNNTYNTQNNKYLTLRTEHEKTKQDYQKLKDDKEEEIDDYKQEIQDKDSQLLKLTNSLQDTQSKFSHIEKLYKKINYILDDFQKQICFLQGDISICGDKDEDYPDLQKITLTISDFLLKYKDQQDMIKNQEQNIAKKEEEQQKQNKTYQKKLQKIQNASRNYEQTIADLKYQLSEKEDEIIKTQEDMKKYKNQYLQLQQEHNNNQVKISQVKGDHQNCKKVIDSLKQEMNELEIDNSKQREEIKKFEKINDDLQQKLKQRLKENESFKQEIYNKRNMILKQMQNFKNMKNKTQKKLLDHKTQIFNNNQFKQEF